MAFRWTVPVRIGQEISGVSFQLAVRTTRKLEAYATLNATAIVLPILTPVEASRLSPVRAA
jgi:hypothetical protein